MKSLKGYQFRLFLIRFFIIGMLAYIVEPLFTGILALGKSLYYLLTIPGYEFDIIAAVTGKVGLLAFFVYCWAAIPFTFLTHPLKSLINDNLLFPKFGIFLRGVVYALIFMGIEFSIGIILLAFKMRAWDYTHYPLNVFGVITFTFFPAWIIAGIFGEWFHERLLQIDDILLNPEGYDDEGIQKAFSRYLKTRQKRKHKSE